MQTGQVAQRDFIVYGWSLSWFLWHEAARSISTTPGGDATASQGYPQHYVRRNPFTNLFGERQSYTVRVKCLPKNTTQYMSPARAGTRTARYGDDRTNHDTTAPLNSSYTKAANFKKYSGDEAGTDGKWLQDGFIWSNFH